MVVADDAVVDVAYEQIEGHVAHALLVAHLTALGVGVQMIFDMVGDDVIDVVYEADVVVVVLTTEHGGEGDAASFHDTVAERRVWRTLPPLGRGLDKRRGIAVCCDVMMCM